jgi:hypothetical protein
LDLHQTDRKVFFSLKKQWQLTMLLELHRSMSFHVLPFYVLQMSGHAQHDDPAGHVHFGGFYVTIKP